MLVLPLVFAACNTDNGSNDPITLSYESYAEVDSDNYNKNLYYLNELKFEIADPSVIYISEGEEAGYFYAYGTSDMLNCFGIQCWRSKDLTNWEYKSDAYAPDFDNTWGISNHWAPEVLYDDGIYLMFYSADVEATRHDTGKGYTECSQQAMSVVYSLNPYGPFVPFEGYEAKSVYDFSSNNKEITDRSLMRSNAIDAHAFIDPVSGDRYLYYSGSGVDGYGQWRPQTIFGVKMKDWLHPDYSTLKELTHFGKVSTANDAADIQEGPSGWPVNEGPFMWYENDQYYLTFSVYPYQYEEYNVRQAIADDPLGDFIKIQPNEGGQVIGSDPTQGNVASAGHHSFIDLGDTLMIAYHTFLDRKEVWGGRALAVDTVSFVTNDKGQTLMHANGPTYSYQPLPEEISGYKNVASMATVTATNTADYSKVDYLTDGKLKIHESDLVEEFETAEVADTVITMTFDKFVNVRAILVYNTIFYDSAFWGINDITLRYKSGADSTQTTSIKNVQFDFEWHANESYVMYPGANSIVEFDELPVDQITITIKRDKDNYSDPLCLNEIVVLGKEVSNPEPVSSRGDYSYTNPSPVDSRPLYESASFGNPDADLFRSSYGFNLSHDDGSANAYVEKTWAGNQSLLYFNDCVSTNFYVEVEMSVGNKTKTYIGEEWPKIGIMSKTTGGYFFCWTIDCQRSFSNPVVGYVESVADGSDYYWADYAKNSKPVSGLQYSGNNYAKLAIARLGRKVYLYANDKLIFTIDGTLRGIDDDVSSASAVALFTYNCYTKFRKYSITTDLDEINAKIAALGN